MVALNFPYAHVSALAGIFMWLLITPLSKATDEVENVSIASEYPTSVEERRALVRYLLANELTTKDIKFLGRAVLDHDVLVRRTALSALLRAPIELSVTREAFEQAITSSDPFVREVASREILQTLNELTLSDIFQMYDRNLSQSGSVLPSSIRIRDRISQFKSLGPLEWFVPTTETKPDLRKIVRDQSTSRDIRLLAAWLLLELDDDVGKKYIITCLQSEDVAIISDALTVLISDRPYMKAAASKWRITLVLDVVKSPLFDKISKASFVSTELPEWLQENCRGDVVFVLRKLVSRGVTDEKAYVAVETLAQLDDQSSIPGILDCLSDAYDPVLVRALVLCPRNNAGSSFLPMRWIAPRTGKEADDAQQEVYC